ncbi:uncharacterized protein [Hetaerina americana]|uniref:uncharacterized protein n=1 Tax=Hetaerina americana TaxID=62018 RepID=UPI003A7F4815
MRNATNLNYRISYAAVAGLCAFAGSLFGKLAGTREHIDYVCGALHSLKCRLLDHIEERAKICVGDIEFWLVKAVLVACMILSNTAVWTFFVKALQASKSSLPATLISTATSFILAAVFGALVFGETTSFLWWSGTFMVLFGLLLVSWKRENLSKKED